MFRSLKRHFPDAELFVFTFDDLAFNILQDLQEPGIIPISLEEFEDPELLAVKPTRSRGEYCWTSTSSTIQFVIQKKQKTHCTYLDADLYFYHNPQVLLHELSSDKHVMITAHNYTKNYDQSKVSGKYCVQFMYFDNSEQASQVLQWWRTRCLEWCYNRIEDGKFGDQKYLDDWTTRFSGVHELINKGGGMAPWNIQQYKNFQIKEESLKATYLPDNKEIQAVFYHFHGVKFYQNNTFLPAPNTYKISREVKSKIYQPYTLELQALAAELKTRYPQLNALGALNAKNYLSDRFLKGQWAYIRSNWLFPIFGPWLN